MKIAVLGAGSWGTALAVHLASRHDVTLWARRESFAAEIETERENPLYLPGVRFPDSLRVTAAPDRALAGAGAVVLAVPTQALRQVLAAIGPGVFPPGAGLVLACKGIEVATLALPDRIVLESLGEGSSGRTVVLTGPSFARELAEGQPTAVVAAGPAGPARRVQEAFAGANLRVYRSDDRLGAELCGALKNVVAIAAGVADGLGFRSNTMAALVTRALAEIARLGTAMGARRETFMGLAGLGDLVLTCTGNLSRNRRVGRELGRGRPLREILAETREVAEGVETARAVVRLARRHRVEMPISTEVHGILFEGKDPRRALADLLARPLRAEPEDGKT